MDADPTLFCRTALLPDGWHDGVRIGLDGPCIGQVAVGQARQAGDIGCGIALPGLANVHSHAFQRGMAGLAERRGATADSFWTWRAVMYQFLERLTPDDVEAIAAQAYAEMLASGFTRVGEFHYLHHGPDGRAYADPGELAGRIAAAAEASGIGLSLLPCFYAQGDFGAAPPGAGQRRFICSLDGFARLLEQSRHMLRPLEGATLGIAPHSLRAVTPEQLDVLVAAAPDGPIHIHAAEQLAEVEACVAATGLRPVQWLLAHQRVGPRWCLIHATHMTGDERAALAASGATAGLCPLTEASLGDGIFGAAGFAGSMGIGTDSNILIDAAAELRQLETSQRLVHHARNVLAGGPGGSTGRALFERCLAGGLQALGLPAAGLAVGAPADIVTLDDGHPSLAARSGDTILDSWIFAGGASLVDQVWRAGTQRVSGGRHHDAAAIGARYARCLQRLLAG